MQNTMFSLCLRAFGLWLFTLCMSLHAKDITSIPPDDWHLFADDTRLESAEGVRRIVEPPRKRQFPVIVSEFPWEQNPYLFGSVIYDKDDQKFKMWYMSYNRGKPVMLRTPILYAESEDGLRWTKPKLNLFDFEGNTGNNIVLLGLGYGDLYSPSLIKDEADPDPSRRFKMAFWDKTGEKTYRDGGIHVAFSPDGIHWKRHPGNPVLKASKNEQSISDVLDVMRDPKTGMFVLYTKGWADGTWDKDGEENKEKGQRIIVRSESRDFVDWSVPQPVIRHQLNKRDPQSYGMPVSFSSGKYAGLLRSYKLPGDETIDIQLALSDDGKKWTRVADMSTFLPLGPEGAWDDGMIFTAPLLEKDGQAYIYYGGWDGDHDSKTRSSAIGLASFKVGRFAAFVPAGEQGSLVSKKVTLGDRPISVNADARRGGFRVILLDENLAEIPGYGLQDSLRVNGDDISLSPRWRNDKDARELAGRSVHLKFIIDQGTKLYGFKLN